VAGNFFCLIKCNISHQAIPLGAGGVIHTIDSHINHNCTGLNPASAHHFRPAYSSHQHIGRPDHIRQVLGPGVADGHRGICPYQQQRNRHPHNIGATQHNRIDSLQGRHHFFHQVHAACRCAGHKQGIPPFLSKASNVDGMKSIHILFQADGIQHPFLIQPGRQGKLHKNTIDPWVCI